MIKFIVILIFIIKTKIEINICEKYDSSFKDKIFIGKWNSIKEFNLFKDFTSKGGLWYYKICIIPNKKNKSNDSLYIEFIFYNSEYLDSNSIIFNFNIPFQPNILNPNNLDFKNSKQKWTLKNMNKKIIDSKHFNININIKIDEFNKLNKSIGINEYLMVDCIINDKKFFSKLELFSFTKEYTIFNFLMIFNFIFSIISINQILKSIRAKLKFIISMNVYMFSIYLELLYLYCIFYFCNNSPINSFYSSNINITLSFFFSITLKLIILFCLLKLYFKEGNRFIYKRIIYFFIILLISTIIFIFLPKIILNYPIVLLIMLTYPIFQIFFNSNYNVKSNCFIFKLHFPLFFSSFIFPSYLKGYENNIFKISPFPYFLLISYSFLFAIILLLKIQKIFGARKFIPKIFIKNYHEYYINYNKLKKMKLKQKDCSICLSDLLNGTGDNLKTELIKDKKKLNFMITPCKHVFHTECLKTWLNYQLKCPNCRNILPNI